MSCPARGATPRLLPVTADPLSFPLALFRCAVFREQDRPPSTAEYALLGPQGHGISGKVLLTMHCRPAAAVVGPGGVLGRVLSAALRSKSQRSSASLRREDPQAATGSTRGAPPHEPQRQASLAHTPSHPSQQQSLAPSHQPNQQQGQPHSQRHTEVQGQQQSQSVGPCAPSREDQGCTACAPPTPRMAPAPSCPSDQLSGLTMRGGGEEGAELDGALLDMAPHSGGPLGSGALGVHLLQPPGMQHSGQGWAELEAQLGGASPVPEAAPGGAAGTPHLSAPVPISSKPSKSNSGPLTAGGLPVAVRGVTKAKSRSGPLFRGRKGSRQASRRGEGAGDAPTAGAAPEEGAEGSAQAGGAPGVSQGAPGASQGPAMTATLGTRWGGDLEAMAFWQAPVDSAQVALSPPRRQHWNAVYHHTQSLNQLGTSPGSDSGSFHSQGSAEEVSSNQRRVEEAEAEMKAAAAAAAERQVRSRSSTSVGTPSPFGLQRGSGQSCQQQGPDSGCSGPLEHSINATLNKSIDNSNQCSHLKTPMTAARRSLAFSGPLAFATAGAQGAHPEAMPLPAALSADILRPGGDLWEGAGGDLWEGSRGGRWGLGIPYEEDGSEGVLGGTGGGSRCTAGTQEEVGEGHGPTEEGTPSEWSLKARKEMGGAGRRTGELMSVSEIGFVPPSRPNRSVSEELWARGGPRKEAEAGDFRSGPLAYQGSHAGAPAPASGFPDSKAALSPLAARAREGPWAGLRMHQDTHVRLGGLYGAGMPGATQAGGAPRDSGLSAPGEAVGVGLTGLRAMPKAMSDELRMGTKGFGWTDGREEGERERPEEIYLSGPLVMQSAPWGEHGSGMQGEGGPHLGGVEGEREGEGGPVYDDENEDMMPLEKSESGTRGAGGAGGESPPPGAEGMVPLEKSESGTGTARAARWGTRFSDMEWEGEEEDVWAPAVAPAAHRAPFDPPGPSSNATATAGAGASGPRAGVPWGSQAGGKSPGVQPSGGRFSSGAYDPDPVVPVALGGGRFCSGAYDPVREFDDTSPCTSPHGGSQEGGGQSQEGPYFSPTAKHSFSQPLDGSPTPPFAFPQSVNHCGHSAPLPGTGAGENPGEGQEGSPSPTFLFPGNANHCGRSAPLPGPMADPAAPVPMEADCLDEGIESQFGMQQLSALGPYGQGKAGLDWEQHDYDYAVSR